MDEQTSSEQGELLNAIYIYSFWFRCPKCYEETSISQSTPLCYNTIINCHKCKGKFMIEQLYEEPRVQVSEEDYNEN